MNVKNKKIMIISILLVTILACSLGGYTYAKYKTAIKGGGQVDVAKWAFKVNESSEQIETIRLEQTVDQSLVANGKIAPGTEGEFTFVIDGTGAEVGIDYEIRFSNEKNKPTNLVFMYENYKVTSLTDFANAIQGNIPADAEQKTKEITIQWIWEYESGEGNEVTGNDQIDTQEGIANLDYTFDVVVTGTQTPLVQQ